MKLRSFYATEIDSVKNHCIKLLTKNAENILTEDDFSEFITLMSEFCEIISNKPISFYFRKK